MTKIYLYILLFTIIGYTSCSTLSPTVMFETSKDFNYKPFENKQKITILQPFDQIQILMATNNGNALLDGTSGIASGIHQNSLSMGINYMIRQDSTVKIPTLGVIKLGGLTKDSAETFLEKELGKYYQDPYIKISISNRTIIMFYEEGTSGMEIAIPEDGITLLEAIAQAGGLTENSRAYKIKLIRGDNRNPDVYNYNISSLEEFKKANFILEANDIIYVDSKPRYLNKILSEVQPYLSLITTSLMLYSLFAR